MAEVRGASKLGIRVEGLNELQAQFDRIGKMPKKYLTKAAKLGSDGPLKDARASAPKGKTGLLKRGLHRKMETPNKRKKAVYRIRWNPKYTENYLKKAKRPGLYGGKSPAYYPHSQEYGFKTKKGKVKTKNHLFVAKAIERNESESLRKVVKSLGESIDLLTKK